MGCLFKTTARAFKYGTAAAPRCSNAVQVEGTGDSMEHEHHLTCRPFRLDATHGVGERGSAPPPASHPRTHPDGTKVL
jgi:hypothetical protein